MSSLVIRSELVSWHAQNLVTYSTFNSAEIAGPGKQYLFHVLKRPLAAGNM